MGGGCTLLCVLTTGRLFPLSPTSWRTACVSGVVCSMPGMLNSGPDDPDDPDGTDAPCIKFSCICMWANRCQFFVRGWTTAAADSPHLHVPRFPCLTHSEATKCSYYCKLTLPPEAILGGSLGSAPPVWGCSRGRSGPCGATTGSRPLPGGTRLPPGSAAAAGAEARST